MDKTAFDLRYREYQTAVEEFLQGLGAYMDSRPGGEAFGAR